MFLVKSFILDVIPLTFNHSWVIMKCETPCWVVYIKETIAEYQYNKHMMEQDGIEREYKNIYDDKIEIKPNNCWACYKNIKISMKYQ